MEHKSTPPTRKPAWLRLRLPSGPKFAQTRRLLRDQGLHTVCQEACCPNVFECFSKKTATFLILGDRCTRDCTFCAVTHGPPAPLDSHEPERVAGTVKRMALDYVVITSVTRDDLPDGGAGQFAATIAAVKAVRPWAKIEVLIPDFAGNPQSLQTVADARPDVINHNVETVPRLYAHVRPQAQYSRSLALLERAAHAVPMTKTGMMLGLGEHDDEVRQVLQDLRAVHCRIITMGQYLRPSPAHYPVRRYIAPEEFENWRSIALELGFAEAVCSPFTRSSYHARETYAATRPSD